MASLSAHNFFCDRFWKPGKISIRWYRQFHPLIIIIVIKLGLDFIVSFALILKEWSLCFQENIKLLKVMVVEVE